MEQILTVTTKGNQQKLPKRYSIGDFLSIRQSLNNCGCSQSRRIRPAHSVLHTFRSQRPKNAQRFEFRSCKISFGHMLVQTVMRNHSRTKVRAYMGLQTVSRRMLREPCKTIQGTMTLQKIDVCILFNVDYCVGPTFEDAAVLAHLTLAFLNFMAIGGDWGQWLGKSSSKVAYVLW